MGTLSLLQAASYIGKHCPKGMKANAFIIYLQMKFNGALRLTHSDGIEPPFTTTASSFGIIILLMVKDFYEDTGTIPHSPYSASKASSDHFVRAYHDTYGMPTIVTSLIVVITMVPTSSRKINTTLY